MVVNGQANLLEVVRASDAVVGLPGLLQSRKQQPEQDADDNKQFDQGERRVNFKFEKYWEEKKIKH